ncbi:MAG: carboxymuconolactone decarboxylase family protein [Candidatus Competibacteraceae bacterium]|jgi:uncharacterized peroxidase-related enzyme|nr:carboxymuconolactone decarboxylase family protein [Candidatus Competibacteraceae bacterium]
MTRIRPIDQNTADSAAAELLGAVKKKMGKVPNLIATMAHSPAVANAYLNFSQTLATGKLPQRLREQIALAVGETNNCNYCVAAHTALGKAAGLTEQETRAARQGSSSIARESVALDFARRLVQDRGIVTNADLERVRLAGYTDGEVGEIVANVALNIFTNYFNHVAGTEVDFPAVPSLAAA